MLHAQKAHSSPVPKEKPVFLDTITTDLLGSIRHGAVDVLVFNPPYVPTPNVAPRATDESEAVFEDGSGLDAFARDAHLLSLSYAGGVDGMEVTGRLLGVLPDVLDPVRGVAYVLLCQQNKPEEVVRRVRGVGSWVVSGYRCEIGETGGVGETVRYESCKGHRDMNVEMMT